MLQCSVGRRGVHKFYEQPFGTHITYSKIIPFGTSRHREQFEPGTRKQWNFQEHVN